MGMTMSPMWPDWATCESLRGKFSSKKCQKFRNFLWLWHFKENYTVTTSRAIFKLNWATFYSIIWSHWQRHKSSSENAWPAIVVMSKRKKKFEYSLYSKSPIFDDHLIKQSRALFLFCKSDKTSKNSAKNDLKTSHDPGPMS